MIEIKALSLFQGNPRSSDQEPDFWNSFTKQTQPFACTSNAQLKKPESLHALVRLIKRTRDKESKKGTIKQTQQTIKYQRWKSN